MEERVKKARENILKLIQELNTRIVGREDAVESIILALVARENIVMISEPGCAKTYLIDQVCRLTDLTPFKYLLNRYTTDVELFGVYDIPTLQREGKLVRNWSSIVTADIVFLDEIFKASSDILNTLLSLLNERRVYDPFTGSEVKVRALTIVGASNEIPHEDELQALYDRFSIRIFLDPLTSVDEIYQAFISRWYGADSGSQVIATREDFEILHEYAMRILRGRFDGFSFRELYRDFVIPTLLHIRSSGVFVSNRTMIEKFPKILSAYLAVYGAKLHNFFIGLIKCVKYLAKEKNDLAKIYSAVGELFETAFEAVETAFEIMRCVERGDYERVRQLLQQFNSLENNIKSEKERIIYLHVKSYVEKMLTHARKVKVS